MEPGDDGQLENIQYVKVIAMIMTIMITATAMTTTTKQKSARFSRCPRMLV